MWIFFNFFCSLAITFLELLQLFCVSLYNYIHVYLFHYEYKIRLFLYFTIAADSVVSLLVTLAKHTSWVSSRILLKNRTTLFNNTPLCTWFDKKVDLMLSVFTTEKGERAGGNFWRGQICLLALIVEMVSQMFAHIQAHQIIVIK